MKKLNLLVNVVLVIAVGLLYYLHFAKKQPQAAAPGAAAPLPSTFKPTAAGAPTIAYLDLDSMNEKIMVIKNHRSKMEQEFAGIQSQWENGMRNLENQKNQFLSKSYTEAEAQKFSESLYQQQQQLDAKKQQATEALSKKNDSFLESIQKKLKEFLNEFNKDNKFTYVFSSGTGLDYMVYKNESLNITNDVINGLNIKLKATP
jgi:outer membrane protein